MPIHLQDLPPPGSYEVRESYDVSQGKKEPAQPRTERGKRKKGSFLSSTRRFAPQRDVIIEKPEAANPGESWFLDLLLLVGVDKVRERGVTSPGKCQVKLRKSWH